MASFDQQGYAPLPEAFFTLDEAHERPQPKGWYRARVVLVNNKGIQRVMFCDFDKPPWRKGWVVSFEGEEWQKIGFEGIYKVTDFSMGGYSENIMDAGTSTCRYQLDRFMGIPHSTGNISVPVPPGNLLLFLIMAIIVIMIILRAS